MPAEETTEVLQPVGHRLSGHQVRVVMLTTIVIVLAFLLMLAHFRATDEQNAARHYWGNAITGTIADNYSAGQDDIAWNYDISYTDSSAKKLTVTRLMRPQLPDGQTVTLWVSDRGVFVRGSRYLHSTFMGKTWRTAPWPTTQGVYWSALIFGWVPAIIIGFFVTWLAGLMVLFVSSGQLAKVGKYLGLLDEEDETDSSNAVVQSPPAV